MSLKFQQQIRNRANEESKLLHELHSWTENIAKEDLEIKSKEKNGMKYSDYPPIRGTQGTEEEAFGSQESGRDKGDDKDIFDFATDEAVKLKEKGNEAFKKKKYNEAIKWYTESLELKKNSIVLTNRSFAYYQVSKFKESESDADAAIKLNGQFYKAYYRRALARKELRKYKEAILDLEKVQVLGPEALQKVITEKLKEVRHLSLKQDEKSSNKKKITIIESDSETEEEENETEKVTASEKEHIEKADLKDITEISSTEEIAEENNDDDIVDLVTPSAQKLRNSIGIIEVTVKAGTKSAKIEVATSDSILLIKQQIEAKEKIPIAQQQLTYAGNILASERKISDYRIQNGAILTLKILAKPKSKLFSQKKSPLSQQVRNSQVDDTKKTEEIKKPEKKSVKQPKVVEAKFSGKKKKFATKFTIPKNPPANSFEFEKVWKQVAFDPDERHQYFSIIPPKKLSQLFKVSLTAPILKAFLEDCHDYLLKQKKYDIIKARMENLAKSTRFDMIIMMFPDYNSLISNILDELSTNGDVGNLKEKYQM